MKVKIHNHDRRYDYNFKVADQGIIGVYGVSGSGKSSLLDTIAGYDDRAKGSIQFNGQQLSGIIQCAYMNQHPILFDHWTVQENLEFVKQHQHKPYDKYLDILHCSDLLNKYPNQLSGGEKQRVVFIRTLMQLKQGGLVLLDEPFSALDSKIRKTALELLQKQQECLILWVTHEIAELYQIADELLFIKDGVIELQSKMIDAMHSNHDDLPLASKIDYNNRSHIIYADDVSIALQKHSDSSIVHQLDARIQNIKYLDDLAILNLGLIKSNQTLFAKITKNSLEHLNLQEKQQVVANFKATASR